MRHLPQHKEECAQVQEDDACNWNNKAVPDALLGRKPAIWFFSMCVVEVSRPECDACYDQGNSVSGKVVPLIIRSLLVEHFPQKDDYMTAF